jgi:ABC-type transport system involved in cytochrome c biogenesis permease subunit
MFIYLAATFFYIVYAAFRYQHFGEKMGKIGTLAVLLGVLIHSLAIALRWVESYQMGAEIGHAPLSNMYESMVFFSWCVMLTYLIFEYKYKVRALGAFVAPLGFLGIAVVALFGNASPEISPLVPALKSVWLEIHVMTCFVGYGAFTIAFGASIVYLLRKGQEEGATVHSIPKRAMEWLGWGAITGWLITVASYYDPVAEAAREYVRNAEGQWVPAIPLTYTEIFTAIFIGAIIGIVLGIIIELIVKSLKEKGRLFSAVARSVALLVISFLAFKFMLHNFKGSPAEITIYSVIASLVILSAGYYTSQGIKDLTSGFCEEISYKSIAVGFPFLTAGIVTGAIWANEAWGTYWSWDPKETWSLITWFIYAAFRKRHGHSSHGSFMRLSCIHDTHRAGVGRRWRISPSPDSSS